MTKSNLKTFVATILFFAVACCALFLTHDSALLIADASCKKEIYDFLTDDIIAVYEQEISQKPVVSNMNQNALLALANKHQISVQKTKTILLLCDLCAKSGDCVNMGDLAKMSDGEILKVSKSAIDGYCQTLDDEQKENLKTKFMNAIKKKGGEQEGA